MFFFLLGVMCVERRAHKAAGRTAPAAECGVIPVAIRPAASSAFSLCRTTGEACLFCVATDTNIPLLLWTNHHNKSQTVRCVNRKQRAYFQQVTTKFRLRNFSDCFFELSVRVLCFIDNITCTTSRATEADIVVLWMRCRSAIRVSLARCSCKIIKWAYWNVWESIGWRACVGLSLRNLCLPWKYALCWLSAVIHVTIFYHFDCQFSC